MVTSAPPTLPDHVDLTRKLREATFEIVYMNWRATGLEIEISLVPRDRWPVVLEEGTKPLALDF